MGPNKLSLQAIVTVTGVTVTKVLCSCVPKLSKYPRSTALPWEGWKAASYGKCPERERERESKEASERLEIHEIAPQDYAAHKRVNGKGEEGGKQ